MVWQKIKKKCYDHWLIHEKSNDGIRMKWGTTISQPFPFLESSQNLPSILSSIVCSGKKGAFNQSATLPAMFLLRVRLLPITNHVSVAVCFIIAAIINFINLIFYAKLIEYQYDTVSNHESSISAIWLCVFQFGRLTSIQDYQLQCGLNFQVEWF